MRGELNKEGIAVTTARILHLNMRLNNLTCGIAKQIHPDLRDEQFAALTAQVKTDIAAATRRLAELQML